MCIALYGNQNDYLEFKKFALNDNVKLFSRSEDFIPALNCEKFEAIFISMDNALGMEGAITARQQQPKTPLVWISNDKGFAVQAYRLNVDYFAIKPIKKETIKIALERCKLEI